MSTLASLLLHLAVDRSSFTANLRAGKTDAADFAVGVEQSMNRAAVASAAAAAKITAAQNLINGAARGAGGRFVSPGLQIAADAEQAGLASVRAGKQMVSAAEQSTVAVRGLNTQVSATKMLLASFVVLGFILFLDQAVKSSVNFQSQMLLIQTQARASGAELRQMTQAVLDMAPAVRTGPEELAKGLYHIESVGLRGARALEVLKIAAEGARVGNADLESVTNALVAAVISGIKGVGDMSSAMGTLNGIVGSGNIRMEALAKSLSSGVLSTFKQFGLSIQDFGAALATMTDQGIPAQEAATRLRITIAQIGAPTKIAASQLERIGLTQRALADEMRGPGGLIAALRMLQDHLRRSGLDATEQAQLLKAAFGGSRSSAGLLTLINSLDLMDQKIKIINESTTNFAKAAAEQADSAAGHFQKFSAVVDVLSIAVGNTLIPILTGLADGLAFVLQQTDILTPFIIGLLVLLGIKAVQAVGGFTGALIKSGVVMLARIAETIGLTAATGALAVAEEGAGAGAMTLSAAMVPALSLLGPLAIALAAVAVAYSLVSAELDKQTEALTKQTTAFAANQQTTLDTLRQARAGIQEQLNQAGKNISEGGASLFGVWDILGAKDRIQKQLDVLDAEIQRRMALIGKNADGSLSSGLKDGETLIVDETKSLVELFGTTLGSVRSAAATEGGAAMLEMARGILAVQDAPLNALKTLHTMMKSEMSKQAEITRLYAELQTVSYTEGLKSGDPAVLAAAIAMKKLVTDRLDELTNGAYSAGLNVSKNLAAGMKDGDTYSEAARSGIAVREAANVWTTQYKPAANDVAAALARINAELNGVTKGATGASHALTTMAGDARDALGQTFDAIKTAAKTYFDTVHDRSLKAIKDAHDLAEAQLEGPAKAFEANMAAEQSLRRLAELQKAVANAKTPADLAAAQQSLVDFQQAQELQKLQEAATAAKLVNDQKEKDAVKAENDRYATQVSSFTKEIAALLRHLRRHPEEWRKSQVEVLSLLARFGINYVNAGQALGDKFAQGIKDSTSKVLSEVKALAALAALTLLGQVPKLIPKKPTGPWPGNTPPTGSGSGTPKSGVSAVLPNYPGGGMEPPYVPVPGFAQGTMRVGKTGLALLHADEAVLNPTQATAYRQSGSPRMVSSGGGTIVLIVDGKEYGRVADERIAVRESITTVLRPGVR